MSGTRRFIQRSAKVKIRLTVFEKIRYGVSTIRDIKEEEVFFGEIPLMTKTELSLSRYGARYRFAASPFAGRFL